MVPKTYRDLSALEQCGDLEKLPDHSYFHVSAPNRLNIVLKSLGNEEESILCKLLLIRLLLSAGPLSA